MAIIGFIIFIVVIVVFGILVFGGVSHEVNKQKQTISEQNEIFSKLVDDFNDNQKIEEYGYNLPLAKIISNISIYYANADKAEIPSKEEWEQTIFSLCLLCTQLKKPKDARDFYSKFYDYRDYQFKLTTNPVLLDIRKLWLRRLLDDALFFERWIN